MPGAVVFADSAAGQQRGSRARRSPRCRRGPRSPTDSGALPVSRGFPRAPRCARSPTSRADAPPGRMRRPARGAARCSRAGSGPSGACAVPGSSVAAAVERWDRGGHAVSAVVRSSPGMLLTAAGSGLRGLSLPGLPLLAAREHRGTGGALTGCGRELLKLERPQKGKEEETEGHLAGSCLLLQARERLPLPVWKDPSLQSTAGGGQSSDWSYRRGREERRRRKCLNWQRLLAVLRTRAVVDVSWHRFALVALSSAVKVRDRWKDSIVVCI
ncbi:uncharacterized protein [Haliaeetus albicilla]|uniref:uncharacterized protein isoform X2 n=1 Tax=Haliaeetus albicilla TaxID=8969 RepID=UPI0037E7AFDF